jgi:photosystem II stability/assembly factor-like uncharacterized protein
MSEQYRGDYAPELFDEEKKYYLLQAQELSTLTDAELRDMHDISQTALRRFVQAQIGTGSINNGFLIAENTGDTSNNFKITGGDGTLDNPGAFFLDGYRCILRGDIDYKDQTNTGLITDDGYTETPLVPLTTPTGPTGTLNALVVNGSNTVAVGSSIISVSTNAGRSWTDSVSFGTLYGVDMADTSTGYAVGLAGFARETVNGGITWSGLTNPLPGAYTTTNFYGVSYVTPNIGWLVGDAGTILKWYITLWGWPVPPTSNNLYDVYAADASHVWAVGAAGTVVSTPDGANWAQQSSDTTNDLNKVLALSTTSVFAVGDSGTIIKTTDAGVTWDSKSSDTTSNLYGVAFVGTTDGFAVGSGGILTVTKDAGETWDATVLNSSCNFTGIAFTDSTGFIVGNGQIYRTLDGTNWEHYRKDYVYLDVHLAEVSADSSSEYHDPDLEDLLIGLPSANRLRLVSDVKVSEGWPAPSDYKGPDGTVQHYTSTIASIQRSIGQSNILQANITDLRPTVRTISELDQAIRNGGIDGSSIAAGSITPDKLSTTADYTFGSLQVTGDTTIGGDLAVNGKLTVLDVRTSTFMDSLTVGGSTILGDTIPPYDDTVGIYGRIIQYNDQSAAAYQLTSTAGTLNAPVFDINSQGSGAVLRVRKTSDSTNCLFDVNSYGNGYDFCLNHLATAGGVFRIQDDASNNTFSITKDSASFAGSVFNVTTRSVGPVLDIANRASTNSVSIRIDQTSGVMLSLNAPTDASGISITSAGSGKDLRIVHAGSGGMTIDVTSSSLNGALNIANLAGQAVNISQQAAKTLMSLDKDNTGGGRVLEINNRGTDTALQVNNDGSNSIALHVSHTGIGDSTSPAVHVFVAGGEHGPALYINKSNQDSTRDVGQVAFWWNQGYSETGRFIQDNTDSTSPVFIIENTSLGKDWSSRNWWINWTGDASFAGDVTTANVAFDTTHHFSADAIWLDYVNIDSSNTGVRGQVYRDYGFLRISDGTSSLPPPFGGQTGPSGATGIQGSTGTQGVQGNTGVGFAGDTGLMGPTGIQGLTGPFGGPIGDTGLMGPTGTQGETGIQGYTGAGSQGETGIQGLTGPFGGPPGDTGLSGSTGLMGPTGVQGDTGAGLQGVTGLQGATGPLGGPIGVTGLQGATGLAPGAGIAYNTVSRYAAVTDASAQVWIVSSSSIYANLPWSRTGTDLTIQRDSHGHVSGDRVIVRNTNMDYQTATIDSTTASTFTVTTTSTDGSVGSAGAYSLGFVYSHTGGATHTGGIVYAPSGDHADVQLLSMRIATGLRLGTTYNVTVPGSAVNGAGANSSLDNCYVPDYNVRGFADYLPAIGATIGTGSISGGYSTFQIGNLGTPSLSNNRFILLHF